MIATRVKLSFSLVNDTIFYGNVKLREKYQAVRNLGTTYRTSHLTNEHSPQQEERMLAC